MVYGTAQILTTRSSRQPISYRLKLYSSWIHIERAFLLRRRNEFDLLGGLDGLPGQPIREPVNDPDIFDVSSF